MKLFKVINQKKGFTIIELLMALSILLIVIGLGFMFNLYVIRSFDVASKQSKVQQNVRFAKKNIEDYVRYSEIELLDELPETQKQDYQIIYEEGGIIKHIDKYGSVSNLLGALSDDINMQLYFENQGNSFLRIKVLGNINGEHTYMIDSDILIYSIAETGSDSDNTIQGENGSIIYFYAPEEDES